MIKLLVFGIVCYVYMPAIILWLENMGNQHCLYVSVMLGV